MACKGGLSVLTTWRVPGICLAGGPTPGLFDPGPPLPARAEDLDQVLEDFLPETAGTTRGGLSSSRSPFGWQAGLIERHDLEPEAEDAAEGVE